MAVTITSQPSTPVIAPRPVRYVFTSDTSDLQYLVCLPVIDGVNYPARSIFSDASGNYTLDVSRYLQDALAAKAVAATYNLRPLGAGTFVAAASMSCTILVKVYEVYGTSQPFTDNYASGSVDATTNTTSAVLITRQHTDTQNIAAFTAGSSASRFLTNSPSTRVVSPADSEVLNIYVATATDVTDLYVVRYDSSGTALPGVAIPVTAPSTGIVSLPIGPANLNAYSADFITDHTKYILYTRNGSGVQTSEARTYVVDYDTHILAYRLHWKNPYNGYDSYTFTGDYQKKRKANRTTYQKDLPASFVTSDKGMQVLQTLTDIELTISSYFESQTIVNWLNEIMDASDVFLEQSGDYIPLLQTGTESLQEDVNNPIPVFQTTFLLANRTETLHA